jgi:8-oxo-dGTP diphosphatase
MRTCLSNTGIEIIGLNEFGTLPDAPEEGNVPMENARQKAQFYFNIIKKPLFSCDSGLFFDPPNESLSPGVHIRGWGEVRLSDEETIEHYAKLAKESGGIISARYRNAITLITADGIFESEDDALATAPFGICPIPHEKRIPGWPIDSISVHLKSGEYYFDRQGTVEDEAEHLRFNTAWKRFFMNSLNNT